MPGGFWSRFCSGVRKATQVAWKGLCTTATFVKDVAVGTFEGAKKAVNDAITRIRTSRAVTTLANGEQRTTTTSTNAISKEQELLDEIRNEARLDLEKFERKLAADADKSYRELIHHIKNIYPDMELSHDTFDFEKRLQDNKWMEVYLRKTISSSNVEFRGLLYMPPSVKKTMIRPFIEKSIACIEIELHKKADDLLLGQMRRIYQAVVEHLDAQVIEGEAYVRELRKMRNDAGKDKSNHEQALADAELTLSMCRFIIETAERTGGI